MISGDCVSSRRQFAGANSDGVPVPLNNATGCIWDQLKTLDMVEDEIDHDQSRLIVRHDSDRWEGLPVINEVEGYKIVKAG